MLVDVRQTVQRHKIFYFEVFDEKGEGAKIEKSITAPIHGGGRGLPAEGTQRVEAVTPVALER
jgi:hypothetical protein